MHLPALSIEPAVIGQRLVWEVERCISALHRIEASVAPLITRTEGDVAGHALQDIDLVGQSLADIARCLEDLCPHLAGLAPVDARLIVSRLQLDDLARRMAGLTAPLAQAGDAPAERIELF